MNLKGIAKSYRVENIKSDILRMTLSVWLETTGQTVDVVVTGTLKELCTRFNAIPYKGSLVCHNLVNSKCIVNQEPSFQLLEIHNG